MVRRIVGVLAAIGRGELKAGEAARLLQPSGASNVKPAELTAPAAGLFLESVTYRGEPGPSEIKPVVWID
jgi:tRNA U38,U39,U40 pseudouridine synthase TruA